MATNPPALLVKRNFPRPPEALVARVRAAPTGWIVDANARRGALDHRIRPITRAVRFCGVALTVHSRARDNLAPYAAIAFARAGDVLVCATDAYEEASVAGDILLGMAKNQGVIAFVTDGMVRDIDGLNGVGIPVFACGVTPNSPYKDGPGEIGLPIAFGGITLNPGDVVAGDENGVVVVAREALEGVAAALDEVASKEAKMDEWVRNGAKVPPWLEAAFAEKGVRYLD